MIDALNTAVEDEFSEWDMLQNLESQSSVVYEPSIGPWMGSDFSKGGRAESGIYRDSFTKPPGDLDSSYGQGSAEHLENHARVVDRASLALPLSAPESFGSARIHG